MDELVGIILSVVVPIVVAIGGAAIIGHGARRRVAPLAEHLGGTVGLFGRLTFERGGLAYAVVTMSGGIGGTTVLQAFVDVDGPWYVGLEGAETFLPLGMVPGPLHEVVVGERRLRIAARDPAMEGRLVAALAGLDPRRLDLLLPPRFGSVVAARIRHVPEGLREEVRCFVLDAAVWEDPTVVTARADALAALVRALLTPVPVPSAAAAPVLQ